MRLGLLIPSMSLLSPVIGIVVDKYGPKITAYLQGVCCIVGLLIIIAGSATRKDPLLFVGFTIIAINVWMGSQLILQLGLYFSGTLQIHFLVSIVNCIGLDWLDWILILSESNFNGLVVTYISCWWIVFLPSVRLLLFLFHSGHTISRVIMILNALFDGGATTYIILWFINKNAIQNVSKTLGIYTAIGAVLFALQSYFWSVAVPSSGPASGSHDDAVSERHPSSRFSHFEDLMSSRNLQHAIQNNISTRLSQRFLTAATTISTRSLNASRHGHSCPLHPSESNDDNEINLINPDLSIASAPMPSTDTPPSHKHEHKHKSTRLTMMTTTTTAMDVSGATSRNKNGNFNDSTTAGNDSLYENDNDFYLLVSKRIPSAQLRSTPFLLLCMFFATQVGICNWWVRKNCACALCRRTVVASWAHTFFCSYKNKFRYSSVFWFFIWFSIHSRSLSKGIQVHRKISCMNWETLTTSTFRFLHCWHRCRCWVHPSSIIWF